ncbi:polyprenyl synthetase family protein [Streptomyces sp. NPDC050211]|uniref:polyprenyl synthetase family protein n=1 Tax=Streptomyces sp. NPDC050211 TaxID=3154932 RepID=UPI003428F151
MTDPDTVRARIAERLDEHLTRLTADTACEADRPLIDRTATLCSTGGKLLHGRFCHAGWLCAGGDDDETIFDACAAVELFKAACLLQDDIVDNSALRRGQASLHQATADLHAKNAWRGPAAHFGTATALSLGGVVFGWAYDTLARSFTGLDPAGAQACLAWFSRSMYRAFAGEVHELYAQATNTLTPDTAWQIAMRKTGTVTAYSFNVGAVRAPGGRTIVQQMETPLARIGTAFQFRDDLLGMFGDVHLTGKSDRDDLRDGKPTLLACTALERLHGDDRARLLALYTSGRDDDAAAQEVRALINQSGAVAEVEDTIGSLARETEQALAAARLPSMGKQALATLVHDIVWRNR